MTNLEAGLERVIENLSSWSWLVGYLYKDLIVDLPALKKELAHDIASSLVVDKEKIVELLAKEGWKYSHLIDSKLPWEIYITESISANLPEILGIMEKER